MPREAPGVDPVDDGGDHLQARPLDDTVVVVSKPSVPTRRRVPLPPVLIVLLVVILVVAAGVTLVAWTVHREWDRLDSAVNDFEAPGGFTQVARVRQRTAFCFVSCDNGGEAVETLVFKTDAADPQEACRALRQALVDLVDDDVRPLDQVDSECG
jgi:hypothetical protein